MFLCSWQLQASPFWTSAPLNTSISVGWCKVDKMMLIGTTHWANQEKKTILCWETVQVTDVYFRLSLEFTMLLKDVKM